MARPRKQGVARTPSGQLSRAKIGGRYFVYLAYVQSENLYKVGSTGNVQQRLGEYIRTHNCRPVLIAEFAFADRSTALMVESEAVLKLAEHGLQKSKREWFSAPLSSARLIASIVEGCSSPHSPLSCVMGASKFDRPTDHFMDVAALNRLRIGHLTQRR